MTARVESNRAATKPITVTGWSRRCAEATLDGVDRESDTGIFIKIENPGESNDPEAIQLVIEVTAGPGRRTGDTEKMRVDLRAPDFRSLLATLEHAIEEAEGAGILEEGRLSRHGG